MKTRLLELSSKHDEKVDTAQNERHGPTDRQARGRPPSITTT